MIVIMFLLEKNKTGAVLINVLCFLYGENIYSSIINLL